MNERMKLFRWVSAALLLCAGVLQVGCAGGGYELRGRVIHGDYSAVSIVEANDPRLTQGDGIGGITVHVQQDPGQLNRRTLARASSGGDGSFALPIDLIGAGVFNHDVAVFARRQAYSPASGYFRLPPRSKRILIVMTAGADHDLGEERENLYDEYERFRDLR
jgi:hypothetical protein